MNTQGISSTPASPVPVVQAPATASGSAASALPILSASNPESGSQMLDTLRNHYGAIVDDANSLRRIDSAHASFNDNMLTCGIGEWSKGSLSRYGHSLSLNLFGNALRRVHPPEPKHFVPTHPGLVGAAEILNKLENPIRSYPHANPAAALACAQRDALRSRILDAIEPSPLSEQDRGFLVALKGKVHATSEHARDLSELAAARAHDSARALLASREVEPAHLIALSKLQVECEDGALRIWDPESEDDLSSISSESEDDGMAAALALRFQLDSIPDSTPLPTEENIYSYFLASNDSTSDLMRLENIDASVIEGLFQAREIELQEDSIASLSDSDEAGEAGRAQTLTDVVFAKIIETLIDANLPGMGTAFVAKLRQEHPGIARGEMLVALAAHLRQQEPGASDTKLLVR